MIDLSTEYLGIKLSNPLVPSSSPLTGELDSAMKLEDAGASALVLPSLFEEAIEYEQQQLERFVNSQSLGHYEALSYQPIPEEYSSELDRYLERIQQFKSALDIPVIASLNGISTSGWIETGKELQQAGADAIELNVYYIAGDPTISGEEVENRYLQLLADLRGHISLPVRQESEDPSLHEGGESRLGHQHGNRDDRDQCGQLGGGQVAQAQGVEDGLCRWWNGRDPRR